MERMYFMYFELRSQSDITAYRFFCHFINVLSLHIADCHSLQTQRLRQISSSGSHFHREKQKHRLHSSVPKAGQTALPARRGGLRLHQRHLLTGNTS